MLDYRRLKCCWRLLFYGYAFTRFSLGNRAIFLSSAVYVSECVCAPFSRLLFYIKPLDQHFFWIRVIMQNTQYSARNRMHTDRMIDTLAIELTLCETLENLKYDRQIWLEWWPSSLHDTLPYERQNAAVWCRYLLANLQCILNIWLLSLRNEKGPIWMIAFVKYTHFDRLICMLAASFT